MLAGRVPVAIKRATEPVPVDEFYPEYTTDDYTAVLKSARRSERKKGWTVEYHHRIPADHPRIPALLRSPEDPRTLVVHQKVPALLWLPQDPGARYTTTGSPRERRATPSLTRPRVNERVARPHPPAGHRMASLADLIAECGGDDGLVPTAQSAHVAPVPVPTAAPALPIVTAGERDTVAGASMLPYKRPAAVHTPRSDELKAPAVGTSWRWRVQRVGGDGAESGPNAIVQAFSLKKGEYVRINCSVHVQRADTGACRTEEVAGQPSCTFGGVYACRLSVGVWPRSGG